MAHEKLNQKVLHLDRPDQVDLLLRGGAPYLAPFLGRDATLSDAARQLHMTRSAFTYHLKRLLALNLIHVTRVEPRAGSAVKHYRAVADAFFVPRLPGRAVSPGEAMRYAFEPFDVVFYDALTRTLDDSLGEWGTLLTFGPDGQVVARVSRSEREAWDPFDAALPAVLPGGWVTDLRLSFEDAKAMQRELDAVRRKYLARGGSGRYLLQLRMCPLPAGGEVLPKLRL